MITNFTDIAEEILKDFRKVSFCIYSVLKEPKRVRND